MISGDVGGSEFAGGYRLDTAILALRQAQGEGIWWGEPEVISTIGHIGSAGNRKPVNTSTLTLSLSKGEHGNAEMAFAVTGAHRSARSDNRLPAGVSLL